MAHSIESIIINACQNGSLYRVYINNCMPEWLAIAVESIMITACQNGSLYRVYNDNCMPEWLTIIESIIITTVHGSAHYIKSLYCVPDYLTN